MNRGVSEALATALDENPIEFDGLQAAREDGAYVLERGGRTDAYPDVAALESVRDDPYVRNWYHWERTVAGRGTARRAFLRWLERAAERTVPERVAALREGATREWGQLRVTVAFDGDGERVYDVRHRVDAGAGVDGLTRYGDPLDARELVTYDDRGRYRPLKTAPSLPTGWVFEGLSGAEAVRTVDFVYPATVANWHREREGNLDVTHYRETAERQTGIYDLIDELPAEAVDDLAAACCADDACLKRRAWDEDADTDLDAPRGDGAFPCREPCSLFVSAARRTTIAESETPREYTFELTPSEKAQLEELIDAVADGRVDEVREADLSDGANRYRARYLRAKRVTERGLSDVPTVPEE